VVLCRSNRNPSPKTGDYLVPDTKYTITPKLENRLHQTHDNTRSLTQI